MNDSMWIEFWRVRFESEFWFYFGETICHDKRFVF